MKYRFYIVVVGFVLFFAVHVNAQYMGNVVVHSDPRLAILLKKNPTAAPPPTPVAYPGDKPAKKVHKVPAPAKSIVTAPTKIAATKVPVAVPSRPQKTPLPPAPTHDLPSLAPVAEVAANNPRKVDATHPNAAPVRQFVTPAQHKDAPVLYSGKGFRVQIYNGSDRDKAIKRKIEFMRRYPGMRTYLTFLSPCFRVKVGDYRNRSDALGMLREANSMYDSPCMIVPDDVTIRAY